MIDEKNNVTFWKNFQSVMEREATFETGWLMDNLPLGVAVVSVPCGTLRYTNSVFTSWVGMEPEEFVGLSIWDNLFTEASNVSLMRARFQACMSFGSYDWFELTLKHKQGEYFKIRTRGSLEELKGERVIIGLCEPFDLGRQSD